MREERLVEGNRGWSRERSLRVDTGEQQVGRDGWRTECESGHGTLRYGPGALLNWKVFGGRYETGAGTS